MGNTNLNKNALQIIIIWCTWKLLIHCAAGKIFMEMGCVVYCCKKADVLLMAFAERTISKNNKTCAAGENFLEKSSKM